MKIKGFDAILGPVMSIRSVCLCFEKTGITDFETISKIFSEEEVFLFSSVLIGKCFRIIERKVVALSMPKAHTICCVV